MPQLRNTVYADVRLHHILSHASGLVPNAYDNLVESPMAYNEIVARLMDVKQICQPGQCYGYQNVMFSLIGDVIHNATHLSYQRWLEAFLFQPLNMHNAGLGLAHMQQDKNYAKPHVRSRKRWHTVKLKPHYYKVGPAAGVNASAKDMSQWLLAQLGAYPTVLSIEALSIQTRPYTETRRELRRREWRRNLNIAHYGLGWRVYDFDNETLYYHSGWVQGYRTDVVVIPRLGVGFSLLLNAESSAINQLTTGFVRQLLALASKPDDISG